MANASRSPKLAAKTSIRGAAIGRAATIVARPIGMRQHEPVIIIGMLADQVDPAGGGEQPRLAFTIGFGEGAQRPLFQHRLHRAARSRAAASSGVRSRCASASSSKPTMCLRTLADRSSGG